MGQKKQLSRADLLDCLRVHGAAHLEAFAATLGYTRRAVPQPTKPPVSRTSQGPSPVVPQPEPVAPVTTSKERFYRVIEQRQLDATEVQRDEPEWYIQAIPFEVDDATLRAAPQAQPPPAAPPLLPWSRLWPFVKLALGAQQTLPALDMPRIVERLARGHMLTSLPRQQHHSWAPQAQIIVDYAAPLLPFWDDFNALLKQVKQLRGAQGLEVMAFLDGDPLGRCWLSTPRGWRPLSAYQAPTPGTPILVLSDLGCLDETASRRRRWCRLGVRLQRAGCQPVALMPCPARWWDREIIKLFYVVCWDRSTRLPRYIGGPQGAPAFVAPEERRNAAARLLNLLAPAIRVEPALLRVVRYVLSPAQADVGSEAAAWNHPHVYTTPLAFYYDQEEIPRYRQAYTDQEPALQQAVGQLLEAFHATLSPTIGYEEQLLLSQLTAAPEPEATHDFLARLVKTLYVARAGAMAEMAHAWVQRMSRRQHAQMWHNDRLAAAWIITHLRRDTTRELLSVPVGLDLARVNWLLALGATSRSYTVRQRGQMLCFETTVGSTTAAELDTPGSPLGTISAAAPYVHWQQIEAAEEDSERQSQSIDQVLPLPSQMHLRLRTDYQELFIDSITRPDWAESIGRDAHGLFVSWQSGQRRAYWVPPGLYPVSNRAGEPLGNLEVEKGHWCDVDEALTLLSQGFQQPTWATDYGLDDYGLYAGFSIKGIYQRMRWLSPGKCKMGSPENEAERYDDETQHRVMLSRGLWLADTACTQALWQAVMARNPSRFKGDERPVERVSWDDVQDFLRRVNDTVSDRGFRLPTEAEWEYACRADTTTAFWFGDQITPEQVNYDGNYPYAGGKKGVYREETVDVKALPCNRWGLYQMHGNVWEWCRDWYGTYPTGMMIDPTGPSAGEARVLRGGSWLNDGGDARSAYRDAITPDYRGDGIGFRLARGQAISEPEPQATRRAGRRRRRQ